MQAETDCIHEVHSDVGFPQVELVFNVPLPVELIMQLLCSILLIITCGRKLNKT